MLIDNEVAKVERFVTPDGVEHTTIEMARYWNARNKIVEMIHRVDPNVIDIELAASIASVLGQNPDIVRKWVAAVEAIERTLKLRPVTGVINENP